MDCPCCSGRSFALCCGPLLEGQPASSAEALMRSRYTAFCLNNIEYLLCTMAEERREGFDSAEVEAWNAQTRWTGLEVLDVSTMGELGIVRFRTSFFRNGRAHSISERSVFSLRDGRWYYVAGEHEDTPRTVVKPGRNAMCPCGSGKKFKKCCGGGQ